VASHGHYKTAAEDDTFLLRAYSWLDFSILSLLNATPGTGLRMSAEGHHRDYPPNLLHLYLAGDLPP
jgi:hypothetical protein